METSLWDFVPFSLPLIFSHPPTYFDENLLHLVVRNTLHCLVLQVMHPDVPKLNFSVDSLVVKPEQAAPVVPTSSPLSASNLVPSHPTSVPSHLVPPSNCKPFPYEIPPLLPLAHNSIYGQSSGDNNLYIDEDYDN